MHNLTTRYKAIVHYNHFLKSLRKVSKIYGVSKSALQRWLKSDPQHKKARKKTEIRKEISTCISRCLDENPHSTLETIAARIATECNIKRSGRTLGRYLKHGGWTHKKSWNMVDYKHNNTDIKRFCEQYLASSDTLICVDEAGFYVGDHPRKGWAKKGKKLSIKCGKTLRRSKFTLIMAVSAAGIVHHEILDHNCKKVDFVKFLMNMNAPQGSTLLMDNIRFHHSKETKEAAATKGFSLFHIPPYSPKMNAIENVFGSIKPDYRKRCPHPCDPLFDYKALFEQTLPAWHEKGFARFFSKVNQTVTETLAGIIADPLGYTFCGYDD